MRLSRTVLPHDCRGYLPRQALTSTSITRIALPTRVALATDGPCQVRYQPCGSRETRHLAGIEALHEDNRRYASPRTSDALTRVAGEQRTPTWVIDDARLEKLSARKFVAPLELIKPHRHGFAALVQAVVRVHGVSSCFFVADQGRRWTRRVVMVVIGFESVCRSR